jgi:hypothetical protein
LLFGDWLALADVNQAPLGVPLWVLDDLTCDRIKQLEDEWDEVGCCHEVNVALLRTTKVGISHHFLEDPISENDKTLESSVLTHNMNDLQLRSTTIALLDRKWRVGWYA